MKRARFGTAVILGLIAGSGCNCDEEGLVSARPRLELSAERIDFGEVPLGDFRLRSLTLANRGEATLEIGRFALVARNGEFIFATPVPTTLGPAQSLDFNLVFQPEDVGEETASVEIETNEGGAVRVVTLHGIGVAADVVATPEGPSCGATPLSTSFGAVSPGQKADRTVTVKATGSAAVTIKSARFSPGTSGEFTLDEMPQNQVLEAGQELVLHTHYTPADGGPDSGELIIETDVPARPTITISLCGEGVAPAICATPLPLLLSSGAPNSISNGTMRITSCGSEAVTVSALSLSSDAAHMSHAAYRLSGSPTNLPLTLQPGDGFDVTVEITIPALGRFDGWVQVGSTAFGHPDSWFPVVTRGLEPCGIIVAPTQLTYANVAAGSSAVQSVLIANNGASSCAVPRAEITQGAAVFSLNPAPSLPLMVPAGGSATLQVQYAPTAAGVQDMGVLEIEEAGGITQVNLLGNPMPPEGCQVAVAPAFVNFGVVPPNATRSMGVQLTNISSDICFLRGVRLAAGSSPDFTNTSPQLGLIAPGRSKTLSVTYLPTAPGAATGQLEITTNDVVNPTITVPIFASSAPTGICVSPRVLPFGPSLGQTLMSFNITACGGQAVMVTALDWTTPDAEFGLMSPPALPFTLAAGANRVIDVAYTPADMTGDTAVVTVRSDDLAEPAIDVTVTGGPEIVPTSAGRFLYYWQIPTPLGGDIMRLPLQGMTVAAPWWGPRVGKGCSGCHSVSPDGRYVAVVEVPNFLRVVDTQTNIALALPNTGINAEFISWNPDVNTNPPYQYVYDDGSDVQVAALFTGTLRALQGANDPTLFEKMPTWGRNGKVAFVRGMTQVQSGNGGGSWGFNGPTDILVVDVAGGVAQPVPGASSNSRANYYPAFSPNGQWIAFTQSQMAQSTIAAPDAQLKLAKADLSGVTLDLPNANRPSVASSYPTWAVDGTFLSFASNRPGGAGDWDIYVAPIDPMTGIDQAANNVTAANTAGFEHSAQWSP